MDFWKWLDDIEGEFYLKREDGGFTAYIQGFGEPMLYGLDVRADSWDVDPKTAVKNLVEQLRGAEASYARTSYVFLVPKDLEVPPEFRE